MYYLYFMIFYCKLIGLINILLRLMFVIFSGKALRCLSQKLAGGWLGMGEYGECTKEDRINNGWPCYTEERPIVYCSGRYWNDGYYERVGNDKTLMVFGFGYFIITFGIS